MDAKELRDLIDIISKSSFTTFELEREGFRLKLVKSGAASPPTLPGGAPEANVAAQAPAGPPSALPAPPVASAPSDGLLEMTSPIVGTFYRSPSPSAPAFVEVGSRIRKGQVLCIIEAMKLMNEIEAEADAEIVEVLVANGQPVEFGEVLFRLRPLA